MKCTSCGARLMETDEFCPECGAKVIREKKCPECGALLREGTKFCHKCGARVAGEKEKTGHGASQATLDIPIAAIERNILNETAAEIRADRRAGEEPRRAARSETDTGRKPAGASGSGRGTAKTTPQSASKKSAAAQDHRKEQTVHSPAKKSAASGRKVHYREEEWDDDWDEDDDLDDEGVDVITVMTAVVGVVILVIAVIVGYKMYQRYMPKNYEKAAEKMQEQEQTDEEGEQEVEQSLDDGGETFTVTITHNVNVRDNPSTAGTNILKVAKEGETYTGVGHTDDGEWYEILLEDGSSGYVFHEYVSVE